MRRIQRRKIVPKGLFGTVRTRGSLRYKRKWYRDMIAFPNDYGGGVFDIFLRQDHILMGENYQR